MFANDATQNIHRLYRGYGVIWRNYQSRPSYERKWLSFSCLCCMNFCGQQLLQHLQAAISRPVHASLDMREGWTFYTFICKHMHIRKFMLLIMFLFFHWIYHTFLSHFFSKKISIGSYLWTFVLYSKRGIWLSRVAWLDGTPYICCHSFLSLLYIIFLKNSLSSRFDLKNINSIMYIVFTEICQKLISSISNKT